MKVICINSTPNYLDKLLNEGDVYTVVAEADYKSDGGGYILKEVRHPMEPSRGFKKSRFIPLSEIDEMEMERKAASIIVNTKSKVVTI